MYQDARQELQSVYEKIGRQIAAQMQLGTSISTASFGRPIGGKKKSCNKGYSCGYGCISTKKACQNGLKGQAKSFAEYLDNIGADNLTKAQKKDAEDQGLIKTPPQNNKKADSPSTPVNASKLASADKEIRDAVGSELVDEATANMQKLIQNADVYLRVPSSEVFEQIIDTGRLKTSVEIAEESRIQRQNEKAANKNDDDDVFSDFDLDDEDEFIEEDYDRRRKEQEELMFGGAYDNRPSSERPVYGYLSTDDEADSMARGYGDVILKFKSDVKDRSTLANHDSWNAGIPSNSQSIAASSLTSASTLYGIVPDYIKNSSDSIRQDLQLAANSKNLSEYLKTTNSPYVEAQIHGQAKTSDIAEITFGPTQKPSQKIIDWAKQNSVTLRQRDASGKTQVIE